MIFIIDGNRRDNMIRKVCEEQWIEIYFALIESRAN